VEAEEARLGLAMIRLIKSLFRSRLKPKDHVFELMMEFNGVPDATKTNALAQSVRMAFRNPPFRHIEVKNSGRAAVIKGIIDVAAEADAIQIVANASFRVWNECGLKPDATVVVGKTKRYMRHGIA
jgi:hypothetical protein